VMETYQIGAVVAVILLAYLIHALLNAEAL
jgi:K+-transporting ATPase KdpF subunit